MYCVLLPMILPRSGGNGTVAENKLYDYEALSYTWGDANEHMSREIQLAHHVKSGKFGGVISQSRFTSFLVRSNLYAALEHFREREDHIYLWVDAVCINQDDQKEKTAQVSRMHEIYSEATNVCGWLGTGPAERGEARKTFKFLRDILDLERLDKMIEDRKEPGETRNNSPKKPDETLDNLLLVAELLKNRYFSRRWIVQELALARRATVQWGDEAMDWNDFSDAIDLFVTKQDKFKEILGRHWNQPVDLHVLGAAKLVHIESNLLRKSEDGRVQQKLASLEGLVCCMLLAFEALESRDTIYAALSIARETSSHTSDLTARARRQVTPRLESWGYIGVILRLLLQLVIRVVARGTISPAADILLTKQLDQRIQPNYQKCLLDVCTDFIAYCIEDSNSLDILCRHWAPVKAPQNPLPQEENEIDSLPSWISSQGYYAYGSAREHLGGRKNGDSFVGPRPGERNYHASRTLHPCYRFVEKTKRQRNQEYERAIIASGSTTERPVISRYTKRLLVRGQCLATITQLSGRCSDGVIHNEAFELGGWPPVCTNSEVPSKLWRTLVADRGPDGANPPTWYRRACRQCLDHCNTAGALDTDKVKNHRDTKILMKTFIERVQSVVWNRTFFEATEVRDVNKKHFGLAPGHAEKDDLICIFFGCSVPVVIRPVKDGGKAAAKTFTFVGECFVYGMMDGEALHMASRLVHPYREHSEEFALE
jgi:hypothetical protein